MADAPQEQSPSIGQSYLNSVQNGGDPSVLPQPAPAPSPAAPPAGGSSQNAQTPTPAAPAAPQPDPTAVKHQAIGKLFSGLVGSGSGSSASTFWRSLIGGALVGMGAAEDAPVVARGPYGDVRDRSMAGAGARAFTAEQGNLEHQKALADQQAKVVRDQKQRDFENQQQVSDLQLRKASDARAQQESIRQSVEHEKRLKMLDQTIATGNWEQAQRTAQAAQQQVKFYNDLQDVGATPLQGSDGQPQQFSTHEEAEQAAHDNPQFFIGNFKTRTAYDPTTNKYGIYRVPDSDIKNVQLKDQQGNTHTIPRMTTSEYLDYQTKLQNLQRTKLETSKIGEEITRMHNDFKASSQYGESLKVLTEATDKNGTVDLDKIPAGNRTVLIEHAAKGLEDATRARSAALAQYEKAKESGDQAAIDEANQNIADTTQIARHYGGVLTVMTGNKRTNSAATLPGALPDTSKPGADAFQAEQKAKADAQKKAQADKEKFFNERPAEAATRFVRGPHGGTDVPNPNFNEGEQYIADNPTLTGAQRAEVRATYQKKAAPSVQQFVSGGTTFQIPPDKVSAFLAAHPDAVKQ
jgi:hypothetical protein